MPGAPRGATARPSVRFTPTLHPEVTSRESHVPVRVLSCLVLSCLVLSCLVLSCLVLSCLVVYTNEHEHETAELGFVVVSIDGRGTPGRSKSFHDAYYGAHKFKFNLKQLNAPPPLLLLLSRREILTKKQIDDHLSRHARYTHIRTFIMLYIMYMFIICMLYIYYIY
eukprot:COSAG06_NODE_518_length_14769_cov_75.390048_8_plen_167_part_00